MQLLLFVFLFNFADAFTETELVILNTTEAIHEHLANDNEYFESQISAQMAIVDEVNSADTSWTAKHNTATNEMLNLELFDELWELIGKTYEDPEADYTAADLFGNTTGNPFLHLYEQGFDARKRWPKCRSISRPTIDQAGCGSCGTVAAISSFTDRYCIAMGGMENPVLSPYNSLTCGSSGNNNNEIPRCLAGTHPLTPYGYVVNHGVTTEDCQPYPFKSNCGSPCPVHEFVLNSGENYCSKVCQNDSSAVYYKGRKAYTIARLKNNSFNHKVTKANDQIMREISTRGPVSACFSVYEDFLHYKSGVYEQIAGDQVYLHCVRLIGWGLDQVTGLPYWLAANSWGTEWGEDGFFRILRGANHCGIEGDVDGILV